MNIFSKKLLLAMVVLPLACSGSYAKSSGHRNQNMPLKKMLRQVDLTAEQQVNVDAILQNYRAGVTKQTNKGAFHDDMLTIIKAESFDTSKAEALIARQEALKKDKKLRRMQMTYDVYHALTADQQAKMDLLFAQYEQKMQHRRKGKRKNSQ